MAFASSIKARNFHSHAPAAAGNFAKARIRNVQARHCIRETASEASWASISPTNDIPSIPFKRAQIRTTIFNLGD
jgi:hypothetical protein